MLMSLLLKYTARYTPMIFSKCLIVTVFIVVYKSTLGLLRSSNYRYGFIFKLHKLSSAVQYNCIKEHN